MYSFDDLVSALSVDMIDDLLFSGAPLPMRLKRIYGGQILGQALAAAMKTVETDHRPHSMHAYFLRPGEMERNVIFDVDPIRDGRSFSTRRVVAKQRGRAIFNASISFQKIEDGLNHQIDRPAHVPDPETLEPADTAMRKVLKAHNLPQTIADFEQDNFPHNVIDIRSHLLERQFVAGQHPPEYGYWFRYQGDVGDDPIMHRALLAFISDHFFMGTAMLPSSVNWNSHQIMGASLDHAMWFHTDIRVDQWLYYHMKSPRSARARGLTTGNIYTREGKLIASTAQEGLMRIGDKKTIS